MVTGITVISSSLADAELARRYAAERSNAGSLLRPYLRILEREEQERSFHVETSNAVIKDLDVSDGVKSAPPCWAVLSSWD